MDDDDLCYLTATEALRRYYERALSPVELLTALIVRAQRVNPKINAFTDTYFDEAMAKAKAAEARYGGKGGAPRPLEGIPLAVKDAQRVAGKRTTQGSLIFEHHVDDHSDPMIERLEAAGAIIHARTTTPEFCLSGVCASRLWGITRNPHNLDYGPGGSSGGAGAALAAGTTTLATGTDIGGSIRIPASACGVFGFKPPAGRNPAGPPSCYDRFDHCGPLARSVADAALMQNVTSGPHPRDHNSLREIVRLPESLAPIRGMKIALSMDLGYVPIEPQVRRATLDVVKALGNLGAEVTEVALGWTADIDRHAMHWYSAMAYGRIVVAQSKVNARLMTDYALKFAEAAEAGTTIDDVHKAWETGHRMYQTLGPILDQHDLLICPTLAVPAVKADHDPCDPDYRINGIKVDPEYGWELAHPFNLLHNCPVMSVPSGLAANGVPTGVQIVGRTYDDLTVFRVAAALETAFGFRRPLGL